MRTETMRPLGRERHRDRRGTGRRTWTYAELLRMMDGDGWFEGYCC
jgi:hypothetical protein